MKLKQVNPKDIQVPELRVTSVWDSEALQEFQASLKALGILDPVVCVQTPEGLVLVDGLHRLQEAIAQHLPHVPVAVMDGEMRDVLLQNLVLNNLRGQTRPTELAMVLLHLYEEVKLGVADISNCTGFTEERISNLIWLARAHPELRAGVDDGWLALGAAYEISRLPTQDLQFQAIPLVHQHRLKLPQVRQLCSDITQITEERGANPPPPL